MRDRITGRADIGSRCQLSGFQVRVLGSAFRAR
jgi:hypothetical protein